MIAFVGSVYSVSLNCDFSEDLSSEMSGCLPCFGSSDKDAAAKDSVKKEVSAKDGSVTQSHHVCLGEDSHFVDTLGIC